MRKAYEVKKIIALKAILQVSEVFRLPFDSVLDKRRY